MRSQQQLQQHLERGALLQVLRGKGRRCCQLLLAVSPGCLLLRCRGPGLGQLLLQLVPLDHLETKGEERGTHNRAVLALFDMQNTGICPPLLCSRLHLRCLHGAAHQGVLAGH